MDSVLEVAMQMVRKLVLFEGTTRSTVQIVFCALLTLLTLCLGLFAVTMFGVGAWGHLTYQWQRNYLPGDLLQDTLLMAAGFALTLPTAAFAWITMQIWEE